MPLGRGEWCHRQQAHNYRNGTEEQRKQLYIKKETNVRYQLKSSKYSPVTSLLLYD